GVQSCALPILSGTVGVDMKRVKARKDAVSGKSSKGVENWMKGLANCTVIEGHARFESPTTVRVNDEILEAPQIFVNVGGRATVPPIAGLEQVPYLTNSTMMDVDFLPEHLVVVGASYIGLEFAQIYRRFGSRVTIVELADRVIAREDEDVSQAVHDILSGEGVTFELGANCLAAEQRG